MNRLNGLNRINRLNGPPKGGGISWASYWATRKPSALIVTGMRDTEIDFAWTDNSAGDCSFSIYRSTDGINYASVGTTVAGDTTYTATGLTAGNLYYFYVKGVKSGNESTATNIYDTRFKITVDTTNAGSAADTFILPTAGAGVYNYFVDWGDGGAEQNVVVNTSQTKVYAASGTYQIKIRGTFPRIYFANGGDKAKLMTIDNWGNIKWSSMLQAFRGCANMQGAWLDCPNMTTASFSMNNMFWICVKFNYSISNFNTSTVTDMTEVLLGATSFNQSVANFNTANVTSMAGMFYGATSFNQSVANFNTANVTSMAEMFRNASSFKQSLATFTLGAGLTTVSSMCQGCNINATGTTANYDATLVAWAAQDPPNSLAFHGGSSQYSAAGGGTAARASLIADDLWTITDGGPI